MDADLNGRFLNNRSCGRWIGVNRGPQIDRFFLSRTLLLLFSCLLIFPQTALAHVGSRDVFERVSAGPYRLFVTVRVPAAIPGTAGVDVKSSGAQVNSIQITPVLMAGHSGASSSEPQKLEPTTDDPARFTGSLWMTAPGSWELRFAVSGAGGEQTVAVPVPAVTQSTMTVQRGLVFTFGMLGLLVLIGVSGIAFAAMRDASVEQPQEPVKILRLRAWGAGAAALVLIVLLAWGGVAWWRGGATGGFHPLGVQPVLKGNQLQLKIIAYSSGDRGGRSRSNDDFLPDDGHLMHLYMIRWPEMDAAFHLHPVRAGAGDFRISLPTMPGGKYRLFGDVVHQNGFPETLVASVKIPDGMPGGPLGADDAEGRMQALNRGMLGDSFKLPDGYSMVWDRPATVRANTAYAFRFRLLDPEGRPATNMQPYLGMAGHAAFVKTDGTVFAHTHPEGSAAMAAMMLADQTKGESMGMPMKMAMQSGQMAMHDQPMSNIVEFPYGFPSKGRYRIFIQMKHGTTVETGAFDVIVE